MVRTLGLGGSVVRTLGRGGSVVRTLGLGGSVNIGARWLSG